MQSNTLNAGQLISQEQLYSSNLSSKAALLKETVQVMSALANDTSLEEVRNLVLEDNLLLKQTSATRRAIWEVINSRYFSGKTSAAIYVLAHFVASPLPERDRHLTLFYELAKSLPLVYDLTIDCLYTLYQDGRSSVDKADVLAWLERAQVNGHDEVGEWSPQTRGKVASNYLTIARDFGLLEGKQRKVFARLYMPLSAFVYVLYHLRDEEQSTKAIVTSDDFKLFLMDRRDVYLLLDEATRAGYVTFQQAGDIYDLTFHYPNLTEVVDELVGQV
jgi:hypothetical protein